MWRDAHVPRVSRCAYAGKTPGNCTENPPSSPPCRDWPDCLAVGGVRSEPVSSPRCGFLRTVLTFYNRTWPDLAGLGRTWEGGSLQLEHLLESEEDNEIEILPNGEIRAVGGSDPAERGFKKPLTMREDLGGEYGARSSNDEVYLQSYRRESGFEGDGGLVGQPIQVSAVSRWTCSTSMASSIFHGFEVYGAAFQSIWS